MQDTYRTIAKEGEFRARASMQYVGMQQMKSDLTVAFFEQVDQMKVVQNGQLGNHFIDVIVVKNNEQQRYQLSDLTLYDVDNQIFYAGIGVIGCACFIYFMKLPYMAKAVLFALIPATVVFALFFLDGYTLNKHYLFFITFVMAAIYFDRKILVAFGLIMDLYVVLLYILAADKFLGENSSFLNFITVFCVYNGIMYMLNKLNEWGGELVSESQKGEQEASHLLKETKELVAWKMDFPMQH